MALNIGNYIEMKKAGRTSIKAVGGKVVAEIQMYDQVTGKLTPDVEVIDVAQIEEKIKTEQVQVDLITQLIENARAFLADAKATQAPTE